jgi:ribosomal-protein-alanine N-acetyltransferase
VNNHFQIETPRLILCEFVARDADALFRVIGDADTMLFYLRPFTRAETDEWIARNQRRYAEFGYGLWAVLLKDSGQFIGDCGLCWQDVDEERLLEVAYHLGRDHWGNGYAPEAARACIRYGFEALKMPKLMSLIRPENLQSRRVAEKNGLRIERQTIRVGLVHDVWTVTREEWLGAMQNAKFKMQN